MQPRHWRAFPRALGIRLGGSKLGKGRPTFMNAQPGGGVGVTGTSAANRLARDADLILSLGTRYSDFTTASKTAFQNPDLRFIHVNVAEFDAFKHAALPLVSDARTTLEELSGALVSYRVSADYGSEISRLKSVWGP